MSTRFGFGASGASPPRRRDARDVRLVWLGLALVLSPWIVALALGWVVLAFSAPTPSQVDHRPIGTAEGGAGGY